MPLIIMWGIPSSGKTTRAKEIKKYLEEEHKKDVILLNEEELGFNKNEYYKTSASEKILRASLKSEVERNLDNQTIVILDSLNYIKGYRYEWYWLARSAKTTLTNVYLETDYEDAEKWNSERDESLAFSSELFQDYKGRLEIPNPANRWDSPWIIIRPDEDTPLDDISKAVLSGKLPRAPVSNKHEESLDTNYIYELDKTWNLINDFIIEKQHEFNEGDMIPIKSGLAESNITCSKTLTLHKHYSAIELKNLKKAFINVSKLHPPKKMDNFADLYIAFIDTNYEKQEDY